MINIPLENEETNQEKISYISIENARKESGYRNPIFNLEAPVITNNESSLSRHNDEPRLSIDSFDQFGQANHSVYRDIVAQEIDILCCKKVFTIKTRTYVNFKKTLKILLPFFGVACLILILILCFRIEILIF